MWLNRAMGETRRRGPSPGDPRCVEGGRRGGLKSVEAGVDFRELGRRGGQASLQRYGKDKLVANLRKTKKDTEDAEST